jgi:hypothetical protein
MAANVRNLDRLPIEPFAHLSSSLRENEAPDMYPMYSIVLFLIIIILAPIALGMFVRLLCMPAFWVLLAIVVVGISILFADQSARYHKEEVDMAAKKQAAEQAAEKAKIEAAWQLEADEIAWEKRQLSEAVEVARQTGNITWWKSDYRIPKKQWDDAIEAARVAWYASSHELCVDGQYHLKREFWYK